MGPRCSVAQSCLLARISRVGGEDVTESCVYLFYNRPRELIRAYGRSQRLSIHLSYRLPAWRLRLLQSRRLKSAHSQLSYAFRMLSPPCVLFATSHTVLDKHPSSLLSFSSLQNLASTETIHEQFEICNPSNKARMQVLRTMPDQNLSVRITTKY